MKSLDQVIKDHVLEAMKRADGNQREAARLIGVSRWKLGRKLRAWGLLPPSVPKEKAPEE